MKVVVCSKVRPPVQKEILSNINTADADEVCMHKLRCYHIDLVSDNAVHIRIS